MSATVTTFIPKVFDEHLETVGSLWSRRRVALRSADYTGKDVSELDQLIDAHFDGLAVAGDDAIPLLEALLRGDDASKAFAAASALLRLGTPSALAEVLDAFAIARGSKL